MPHDIVVNKDGAVFVGDAASDSVIKFTSESKWRASSNVQIIFVPIELSHSLNKFNYIQL